MPKVKAANPEILKKSKGIKVNQALLAAPVKKAEARLVTHRGAKIVTLEEVGEVLIPAKTKSYVPLPHVDFIEKIRKSLGESSITITDESYALNRDGAQLFGVMNLALANAPKDLDFAMALGLRNSYDKSLPAECAIGSKVFVCDNLAFSGAIQMGRRHTDKLIRDLRVMIPDMIEMLPNLFSAQSAHYDAYRDAKIDKRDFNNLLIELLDGKAVNVTDIPAIQKAYWESPHPEAFPVGTVWSAFNAVTEVYKGAPVFDVPERSTRLHSVVDKVLGLEPLKSVVIDREDKEEHAALL